MFLLNFVILIEFRLADLSSATLFTQSVLYSRAIHQNKNAHLSGRAALESGAGNRVRTGDLNLGKVALYQLSYSRFQV